MNRIQRNFKSNIFSLRRKQTKAHKQLAITPNTFIIKLYQNKADWHKLDF